MFHKITLLFMISASYVYGEKDYINGLSERDGNISDVRYLLWTRTNPDDGDYYQLEVGDTENLLNSPFNGNLRTYFYYHGYTDNGLAQWILDSKTGLLTIEDCNVISVDYGDLVPAPQYGEAVDNMYLVSNLTAGYIDWLIQETALTLSAIHITGHSLGGQAAGMTGQYVQSGQVDRVSGLDPAGPMFNDKDESQRISTEDAVFVDVIHTNSGNVTDGCVSMYESVGHVDFFPNGGSHQPGCLANDTQILAELLGGCSHIRVQDLWVESILGSNYNGTLVPFTSWPCSDWDTFDQGGCPDCGQGCLNMGFHTETSLTGDYYLRTRDTSPYAIGDNQNYTSGGNSFTS